MKESRIIVKTKNKNYPIIIGENILGKIPAKDIAKEWVKDVRD